MKPVLAVDELVRLKASSDVRRSENHIDRALVKVSAHGQVADSIAVEVTDG